MNLTDQELRVLDAARDFARAARLYAVVPGGSAEYEPAVAAVVTLGTALQLQARRLLDPEAASTFATFDGPAPPERETEPTLATLVEEAWSAEDAVDATRPRPAPGWPRSTNHPDNEEP